MPLENLKSKLHAIFENCGMNQEVVVKEDALPTQTPVVTNSSPDQEFKDDTTGIVYKVSQNPATKQYAVKDQNGVPVTPDIQERIVAQLTTQAPSIDLVKPEEIKTPTSPSVAPVASEPEVPVAENNAKYI